MKFATIKYGLTLKDIVGLCRLIAESLNAGFVVRISVDNLWHKYYKEWRVNNARS